MAEKKEVKRPNPERHDGTRGLEESTVAYRNHENDGETEPQELVHPNDGLKQPRMVPDLADDETVPGQTEPVALLRESDLDHGEENAKDAHQAQIDAVVKQMEETKERKEEAQQRNLEMARENLRAQKEEQELREEAEEQRYEGAVADEENRNDEDSRKGESVKDKLKRKLS